MTGMRLKSHRNNFVNTPRQAGNNPWSGNFRPSPWATPSPKQDANQDANAKPRPIIVAPPPPLYGKAEMSAKAKRAPARKAAGTAKRKTAAKPKAKTAKRATRKSSR